MEQNKRKHHIIPACYLLGFTDEAGKLFEYRSDSWQLPRYNIPRELGHKRDYYAQPTEDGGTNYNNLENLFSKIEGEWRKIISSMSERKELSQDEYSYLFQFLYLMKGRVPATRDSIEYFESLRILKSLKVLEEAGELLPRPKELDGVDLKALIDPHRSIQKMPEVANELSQIFHGMNFVIFHNKTSKLFLTTDNPIVYFNPYKFERDAEPYLPSSKNGHVEFIFPITKTMLLHSLPSYTDHRPVYRDLTSLGKVSRFNRLIAKYAYEKYFSSSKQHELLIKKHCEKSPVLKCKLKDQVLLGEYEFGERRKLPKWKS